MTKILTLLVAMEQIEKISCSGWMIPLPLPGKLLTIPIKTKCGAAGFFRQKKPLLWDLFLRHHSAIRVADAAVGLATCSGFP